MSAETWHWIRSLVKRLIAILPPCFRYKYVYIHTPSLKSERKTRRNFNLLAISQAILMKANDWFRWVCYYFPPCGSFPLRAFSPQRSLFFFSTDLFSFFFISRVDDCSTALRCSPSPLPFLVRQLRATILTAVLIVILFLLSLLLAPTSNYCVPTSTGFYANEMPLNQPKLQTDKVYQSPVPSKTLLKKNSMALAKVSSVARWNWLLFSPEAYPECYTPSATFVASPPLSEESDSDLLASLPTCLLALLCLTPNLIPPATEENEADPEIHSLRLPVESLTVDPSPAESESSTKVNRSSTPDTDDGYQSASDASRSDYSHPSSSSSIPVDHLISQYHSTNNEHRLLSPAHSTRLSYAAAVKPTLFAPANSNKLSSAMNKGKQMSKNPLSTIIDINENLTTNGQKLKFTAPRFERMHHAKQYSSSTTVTAMNSSSTISPSNRTSTRSNNNQRSHAVHSTRRRWTPPTTFAHHSDTLIFDVYFLYCSSVFECFPCCIRTESVMTTVNKEILREIDVY